MNIQEEKLYSEEVVSFPDSEEEGMPIQWCWSVMWLIILILVVWPLSLFAAIIYVILTPFSACCECTNMITEFLHKAIALPLTVTTFMIAGRSCAGL